MTLGRGKNRKAGGATDGLSALAGGLDGDAAGVDNPQLGRSAGVRLDQAAGAEEGRHLLAFVLVDLAAEGLNGERFHFAPAGTNRRPGRPIVFDRRGGTTLLYTTFLYTRVFCTLGPGPVENSVRSQHPGPGNITAAG